MSIKWHGIGSALFLTIASGILGSAPKVKAEPYNWNPNADSFNNAFFKSSGDYFQNTSLHGYFGDYLGIGSPSGFNAFPENETHRDASRIHGLYRNLMEQQSSNDPVIRTPDLPNPFSSSVLSLPSDTMTRSPWDLVSPNTPFTGNPSFNTTTPVSPSPVITSPQPQPVEGAPVRGRW